MIWETGDPDLFPELKIPRSTIRSWLHRGIPDVITCGSLIEIQELRHRAAVLGAIVGLLVAMLRVSERRGDRERLPEGNGKRALRRAIERASRVVPLSVALRITRRLRLATTAGAAPRFGARLTTDPAARVARRQDSRPPRFDP
jgi:hypothetical protein